MSEPIAYLKPRLSDHDPAPALELSPEDTPIATRVSRDLLVMYLVDEGGHFSYVQGRDLPEHGGTTEALHRRGVDNLARRAHGNVTLHAMGPVQHLVFDGNFEASLLLLDDLWDRSLSSHFTTAPVVAIPSRDVLVFCDRGSPEGIASLRAVIDRVWPGGDHLLSRSLQVRQHGEWLPLVE